MAELGFSFNADEVDTSSYELIPDGDYKAIIVETEKKTNKMGDGAYLACTFEIVDVVCNGRKLWVNLNLWHAKEEVRGYAEKDLAAICKAVGVTKDLRDSSQLENIPLTITVKIKTRKDNGETENRITKYSASGPQATTQQVRPTQPAATAARTAMRSQTVPVDPNDPPF